MDTQGSIINTTPAMQITYWITLVITTMVHSENLYCLSNFRTMQSLLLSMECVFISQVQWLYWDCNLNYVLLQSKLFELQPQSQ